MVRQNQHRNESACAIERGVTRGSFGTVPVCAANREWMSCAPQQRSCNVAAGNRIQQGKIVVKGNIGASSLAGGAAANCQNTAPCTPVTEPVPWLALISETRDAQPEDLSDDNPEMGADFLSGVVVAGLLGFTGLSAASADVARFLFMSSS